MKDLMIDQLHCCSCKNAFFLAAKTRFSLLQITKKAFVSAASKNAFLQICSLQKQAFLQ